MNPLLPEVRDELLATATRRRARHRSRRLRLFATLSAVTAVTGASALAAATGVFSTGSGSTEDGGSYTVLAVTSGSDVCLALSLKSPSGKAGDAPTCTPRPLTAPLSQWAIVYVDSRRLVTGVVTDDVASVTVTPGSDPVALKRVAGSSYRYFDVLIAGTGSASIIARDRNGNTIAQVDGDQLGPVGRGRHE